jgi:hypothetical protein
VTFGTTATDSGRRHRCSCATSGLNHSMSTGVGTDRMSDGDARAAGGFRPSSRLISPETPHRPTHPLAARSRSRWPSGRGLAGRWNGPRGVSGRSDPKHRLDESSRLLHPLQHEALRGTDRGTGGVLETRGQAAQSLTGDFESYPGSQLNSYQRVSGRLRTTDSPAPAIA